VTVAVWSERPWPDSPKAVQVQRLPTAGKRLGSVFRRLGAVSDAVAAFRPDLVHAHYVSRYGFWAALLPIDRPKIMSAWGADIEVFAGGHGGLNGYLLRWILSKADAVTASSQYLAQKTARWTSQPVIVIPFGIDLTRFMPRPPNAGPLRWIINKALEPVYGIDLVLEAWGRVGDQLPWVGRVLGEGADRRRLEALAERWGLTQRVQFVGQVPADALPGVLAWADVGLYASRRESFGVAPLEMQALGRAVIVAATGGLPEVVCAEKTGVVVPTLAIEAWVPILADAARHPERFRQMGQHGPNWVQRRYNFDDNLAAMLALYRSWAGRKRG
jgi:glycosyltransferase involved in cell wall biosynthesis